MQVMIREFITYMPVQLSWLEHLTLNQGVEGSNPPTGTKVLTNEV